MPPSPVIGNLKPLSDLDKKFEINPNVVPYLQYNTDIQMYSNGGAGGVGGTNNGIGSKSFPLTGDEDKSKDKSNYIPNTGDPYIDGAFKFGSEAEDIIDELARIGDDFVKEGEDGWFRPDERFSKLIVRLQTLFNLLTALAILWQAQANSKKNVLLMAKTKEEREEEQNNQEKNLLEIVSSSLDKYAKASAKLAKGIFDYVTSKNDEKKKILLDKAQKEAKEESQHWYNDVGDFFGLDSTNREFNERFAKKKEAIEREFEKVQKDITKIFERLKADMAQSLAGDKTEPFSQKMAAVMDKTDEAALIKDAGNGYQDIDKDRALAHNMWFMSMQNARMAYYKVSMARQRLIQEQLENATGIKNDDSFEKAFSRMVSDTAVLERYHFVSYLNQVQTQIAAHNEYTTAIFERKKAEEMNSFWSNPFFCFFLAGGLVFSSLHVKMADWIRLEAFYGSNDNKFTPSDLNMDDVNKIIEELSDSKRELTQKMVDETQVFFNKMESEMSRLEEELRKKGTIASSDGMKAVNWNFVNEINERYTQIQRLIYGVLTLLLAKSKIRSYALKKEPLDTEWVKDAVKTTFNNYRLALDFKIDTIRKQVEEHNRQRSQELELEKSRWGIGFGLIGAAVAVALIAANVVSFGAASFFTVIAYASFISACSAAGSALGDMIFQYLHPVNENVYKSKDFYDEILETDTPEKSFGKALDEARERQKKNIDKINSNDFIDAGRGKRALDIGAVMCAREALTRDHIHELALLMIAKAQQDRRAIAAAKFAGGPVALSDFDGLKSSVEADNKAIMNAFEYKVLMANDEINLHNAKVDQEKALTDAWVSFGISAASGFSSAIGVNGLGPGSSYSALLESKQFGKLAAKAALDATQIGLRTYDLVRAYEYGQAEYGMLIEDTKRLNALIDEIYEMSENIHDNSMRRALREAAKKANTNLVEGIGDGRVAINMKYYFRILRRIDSIYNNQIALAIVQNAKAQRMARILKTALPDSELINALYQDLDRAKAVVQLLYQRLEDYVKFVNAVAEAKKQIIMKAAAFSIFILQKADQVLDGKITDSITKVVDGEVFGSGADKLSQEIKLPSWLSKVLHPSSEVSLIPKELNLHDVVGMAVHILLSENMAQRIALLATKQAEKGLDKKPEDAPEGVLAEAPAKTGDSVTDALNSLDRGVAMAEERTGDIGISEARFEVARSLEQELRKFLIEMISEMPQGYKAARSARWKRPAPKKWEEKEKAKEASRVAPPPSAKVRQREIAAKDFKQTETNTSALKDRVEKLLSNVKSKESKLQTVKQNGNKPVDIKALRDELAKLKEKLAQEDKKMKLLRRDLEAHKSKQEVIEKQIQRLSITLDDVKEMLLKGKIKLGEYEAVLAKIKIMRGGKETVKKHREQKAEEVKESQGKMRELRGQMADVSKTINSYERYEQEEKRKKRKYDPTDAVAGVLVQHQSKVKFGFSA